jgi:hypothetical protein
VVHAWALGLEVELAGASVATPGAHSAPPRSRQ